MMEKVRKALEELKKINAAYGISTENILRMQEEIQDAKVCTPVIGKFSSGKSALVNTILGYSRKMLKEDITPETAIPTEIVYTELDEMFMIFLNDDTCMNKPIEDFREYEADAKTVKNVRVMLKNNNLERIPDVMLVDMPGFESGFEIHNKAIDDYLPQSLAYIVTFPADDMIVRSSIGEILKELCLHDMPLCIVITKYDKANDDFELVFEKMKESLRRYVGDREIEYCITSSRDGEVRNLEEFLLHIQEQSQDILADKYKKLVLPIIETTENYLNTLLNGSLLSESELDEKEEKLHRQLSSLDEKFSHEQEDFELEISECVEDIKNDVQRAMEADETTLVAMTMNGQSISDHLNSVVRNAVTVSVKKNFIPKVEKYLKRVAKTIDSESIGDVHISFSFDTDKINKGMVSNVVAVAATALLVNPLLGIVVGIFAKVRRDRKREEAKQEIRMKLRNEVFPKVIDDVAKGIETTITKQIRLVNISIEDELKNQRDTLEKAMADVRTKMNEEREHKENLEADIKIDLERIGEIKDGLR